MYLRLASRHGGVWGLLPPRLSTGLVSTQPLRITLTPSFPAYASKTSVPGWDRGGPACGTVPETIDRFRCPSRKCVETEGFSKE